MEGRWNPEGNPQWEAVEENNIREEVEWTGPEKKGVLDAKDTEILKNGKTEKKKKMGKLLIIILRCRSGRYYFHSWGGNGNLET